MIRPIFFVAIVLCLLLPTIVLGQERSTCKIQRVLVEPLSNGVLIRIQTDGLVDVSCTQYNFGFSLTFRLDNASGGADPFVKVQHYPVSHLEFALSPDATNGDGLLCTVALYRNSKCTFFNGDPKGWDDTASFTTTYNATYPQVMVVRTRQRNEILIMATSDVPLDAPRLEMTSALSQLSVGGTADSLALRAVNANMREALDQLSCASGIPIYVADDVQQIVTANLKDLSLERILSMLATTNGLFLTKQGESYFLKNGTAENATGYEDTEIRTIPIKNISVYRIRALLPAFLAPYLKQNVDGNALMVTGSPIFLDKIERDITALDHLFPPCQLKAWVITCEGRDDQVREVMASVTGGNTSIHVESDGDFGISVSAEQPEGILAQVRAVSARQRVRVEAVPVMQAFNDQLSKLFVGQKAFYWVQPADGGDAQLASLEAGIIISLRPYTVGEWITTGVSIESSYIREINALGPVVVQQKMLNKVRTRSGDTVIIGSLRQAVEERDYATPLGKNPPADQIFANRTAVQETRQVWILLQAQVNPSAVNTIMQKNEVTQ